MAVAGKPGYQNLRNADPSDGGKGTQQDGDVQPLCRPWCRLKTREGFGAAGPLF